MKTIRKGNFETIETYFLSKNVSQSSLKKLLVDIDYYLEEREEEEKEHFIIGSVVDTLLTCNEEVFNKQFFVYTSDNLPSLVERKVIKSVYNRVKQESENGKVRSLDNYPTIILDTVNDLLWQKNWKDKTRIDKINEKGSEYFDLLKEANNRTIISTKKMEIAENVVKSLKSNYRTHKFFRVEEKYYTEHTGVEIEFHYQFPIYFTYKTLECKALIDLVIIEINKGKITSVQGFDLKTTSDKTTNFLHSVRKFRYDIQAAWYTKALKSMFKANDNIIKPFTFIVESITKPGQPLLYEVTDELLQIGEFGREALEKKYNSATWLIKPPIKGFSVLVDELLFYLCIDDWEKKIEDKMISDSKGKLSITWDNVYSGINKYYL